MLVHTKRWLKRWLMYAIVWICGVTAGTVSGWWWIIPAVVSLIAFYTIDYFMEE